MDDIILNDIKTPLGDVKTLGGSHYKQGSIEPIEYMFANGFGTDFCKGNVVKYISRCGLKGEREDEIKDLIKVIHYAMYILKYDYGENYSLVKNDIV